MGLSRKRQREFTRLKKQTEELLQSQREVLEHAGGVVREASHQAANYAREEVSPRVKGAYDTNVKPVVASGFTATHAVASATKEKVVDDVLPAVASAIASALAVLDAAKSPQVREAIQRVSKGSDEVSKRVSKGAEAFSRNVSKNATTFGTKVGLIEPPKSSGPGKYILVGLGAVAVAGVAYAVWQTLRADDDLWIDDEDGTDTGAGSVEAGAVGAL
ncbi:MAG: hypothetical protein JWM50_1171 [Microbacteriaceae bacterium]|jgi:hypothetical protein|nr:hypothetical protein [Microbacteriaceae bacterium]